MRVRFSQVLARLENGHIGGKTWRPADWHAYTGYKEVPPAASCHKPCRIWHYREVQSGTAGTSSGTSSHRATVYGRRTSMSSMSYLSESSARSHKTLLHAAVELRRLPVRPSQPPNNRVAIEPLGNAGRLRSERRYDLFPYVTVSWSSASLCELSLAFR